MANYLRTLAGDLLNLEVNTIVKESASSAKMPNVRRVALLKIADQYRDYMMEHGYAGKAPGKDFELEKGAKEPTFFRWRYGGEFSFNEIRIIARDSAAKLERRMARMPEGEKLEMAKREFQMLVRIREKSSNLIGLFKMRRKEYEEEIANGVEGFHDKLHLDGQEAHPFQPFPEQTKSHGWNNDVDIQTINKIEDIDLTPEHITMLRKIWEIGIEQVLLQTSIQIDGDITSIIARDFLRMPGETQQMIMKVHDDSISSSTHIWRMLFETIGKLAGKGFNKIFDRKAK